MAAEIWEISVKLVFCIYLVFTPEHVLKKKLSVNTFKITGEIWGILEIMKPFAYNFHSQKNKTYYGFGKLRILLDEKRANEPKDFLFFDVQLTKV